jgi:signal transduction histidine kinase
MGALKSLLPASLFGRLALLLLVSAMLSHVLALTMLFELRPMPPHMHHPHLGSPPMPSPPPMFQWGLVMDVVIRLTAMGVAAWVGARWLSQPIKRLAQAALALGSDIHRSPLPMEGPKECRDATLVFNQMQAQIRQQLSDRDRFVAAVSHDLRTPLTRLRLRVEGIANDAQRQKFQQDIIEMDEMITSTLDYLRGSANQEARVLLDVNALVDSIREDQLDCGQVITVSGAAAPLMAQPCALRRCLSNLVDNAIRYGGSAEIKLVDAPDHLLIEVCDQGAGLPEGELSKVTAPFYRVEGSRNRQHGGVGLGLSIASDIARHHGGRLQLRNGPSAGLMVGVFLPR